MKAEIWGNPLKTLVLLSALFCSEQVLAASKTCSNAQGMAAEEAVDTMKSWPTIYSAFKKFKNCDDGGVAEGFSDAVVHLLASDWPSLSTAAGLSAKDRRFREFILSHIDATTNTGELQAIHNFSKTQCPPDLKSFCTKIHGAAKRAIAENAAFMQ